MLKLKSIKKNYYVADMTVEALKGINLCFRKSEFVSILGPSGCGKTTMLNIIGGLDKYTSGDLTINGKSTKEFNDRDWDVYRNHRIGFIFQSYNLIPHQTILGNVELALTIAGLPKAIRIEKAKKALDKVGLSGQYNKRPNQMSGGQCQRVAIARALVNDPEILLADEPTGALDTQTSIQIMDLIKEISKEKLVIMVTHNPDLAYQYSSRIVKCLDGNVIEDSNPFTEEEEALEIEANKASALEELSTEEIAKKQSREKAKMSLWTAFKLSARNLNSKFKRTLMVAFAGCIGIVGVSTVLSVSSGVQGYIKNMQNDMLSGYPVTVSTSSLDYTSLMGGGLNAKDENTIVNTANDKSKAYIASLVKTLYNMNGITSTNTITKEYLTYLNNMPKEYAEVVQYKYGYLIAPNIYTDFLTSDGLTHNMSVSAIQNTYVSVLKNVQNLADYASMISSVSVMTELPSSAAYLADQYEILYLEDGYTFEEVINDKSSLIAVASKSYNTLNDLELAEYGYFSQEKFLNYCYKIGGDPAYNDSEALALPEALEYKELGAKTFTWYPNDIVYSKGSSDDYGDKYYASAYSDGTLAKETSSEYDDYKRDAFDHNQSGVVDLNVKCVLKLKENLSYGCLSSGGLYYTNALSKHARVYTFGGKDGDTTIAKSQIVQSAEDSSDNCVYNVEMGYKFKFDSNSSTTFEHENISSSSNSAIMDYISQFIGGASSSKKVTSYSLSALGGSEYPSTIYFYCKNFEQKDKLTTYLDGWNSNNGEREIYKIDKETGFYVAKEVNESGVEYNTYYYRDPDTKEFFKVNVNSKGYAVDNKGYQYKLVADLNGNKGFHVKQADKLGDSFTINGSIKIADAYSINAYTLTKYTILGKQFDESNIYFDSKTKLDDYGDYLYSFVNDAGETEYVMKIDNQSYYEVKLDKYGNVLSKTDDTDKYHFDKETNSFYKDDYVKQDDAYTYVSSTLTKEQYDELEEEKKTGYEHIYEYYKFATVTEDGETTVKRIAITEEEYNALTEEEQADYRLYERYKKEGYELIEGAYVRKSTELSKDAQSKLYSSNVVYYANAVLNPTITYNDVEYTLDTNGLYIDTTSIDTSDLLALLSAFSIDQENKVITITDYSRFKFYYKDLDDNAESYYYVDFSYDDHGKGIIKATDASKLIAAYGLEGLGLDSYVSDRYLFNTDGTLQAINESFSDDALLVAELLNSNIISNEALQDLSILELDDSLKVEYSDMIGLIITMVDTLINVVTYALVAFTGLSLVVSTVMIGIITYVSVVERTKEIGVIRSLGGRKKDVSHLFNAETLIIGTSSGILGIALTYLLSLVINLIVGSLTGIYTIASLPITTALIMILVSILLTTVSGIIPARSAARKDPVIALRTE